MIYVETTKRVNGGRKTAIVAVGAGSGDYIREQTNWQIDWRPHGGHFICNIFLKRHKRPRKLEARANQAL
jgi:hypothetical protein